MFAKIVRISHEGILRLFSLPVPGNPGTNNLMNRRVLITTDATTPGDFPFHEKRAGIGHYPAETQG